MEELLEVLKDIRVKVSLCDSKSEMVYSVGRRG